MRSRPLMKGSSQKQKYDKKDYRERKAGVSFSKERQLFKAILEMAGKEAFKQEPNSDKARKPKTIPHLRATR